MQPGELVECVGIARVLGQIAVQLCDSIIDSTG